MTDQNLPTHSDDASKKIENEKNRITVTKANEKLHFYLMTDAGHHYLFTQAFSKGVYSFFRGGRSEGEVRGYKRWERNPRLDKTIAKIPLYVRYVLKEAACA